jgi:hypothetical protein
MQGNSEVERQQQLCLPFRGVKNDTTAYLPLDPSSKEIRYLRLHPGLTDDPIICSLGYSTFDQEAEGHVAYDALSYCWGDLDDTKSIKLYCPVQKDASSFNDLIQVDYRITRNLETALRSLRHRDMQCILWVDAICMNQGDAKEKTHQVGLMNLIYSCAKGVIVWLGELDLDSKIVLHCIELFLQTIDSCEPSFGHRPRRDLPDYVARLRRNDLHELHEQFEIRCKQDEHLKSLLNEQGNEFDKTVFESRLDRVLSKPYFRRVWVYQEVLLAPQTTKGFRMVEIRMGQSTLQWGSLVDIVDFSHSRENSTKWFKGAWSRMGRLTKVSFNKYFFQTQFFEASDSRDKLFALLHLSHNTSDLVQSNPLLSPDYELPLEDIVLNFLAAGIDLPIRVRILRPTQELLEIGDCRQNSNTGFSFGFFYDPAYYDPATTQRREKPPSMLVTRPLNSGPFCPAQGKEIARIEQWLCGLSAQRKYEDGDDSILQHTNQIFQEILESCTPYTGDAVAEFLQDTISKIFDTQDIVSMYRWQAFAKVKCVAPTEDILLRWSELRGEEFWADLRKFHTSLIRLNNTSIYLATDGRLVFSQGSPKPGDLVVALSQRAQLMVLSPADFHTAPVKIRAEAWEPGHGYKSIGVCSLYPLYTVCLD